MNKCWRCKKEFKFWEVWRSYWSGWKIKCPSCRKRQTVDLDKRIPISLLVMLPPFIFLFGFSYFARSSHLVLQWAGFSLLAFLFSLFVPLFKIYGE